MNSRGDDPSNPKSPKEISPDLFYGSRKYTYHHTVSQICVLPPQHCAKFRKLCGPSTIWKIFKKQSEVISYVSQTNCDLLPFTFQTENGNRLFLAAHPVTFWYYDEQRNMKERNSYEIIQEFKACKMYFDLEFDSILNPNHDGNRMVETFIHLVSAALKYKYNISCDITDVLSLTSSTKTKFSCHLIFQLKNEVFCDNYNLGFFVKQLCHEIRQSIQEQDADECLLLLSEIDLPLQRINELEIVDAKGNKKLFCDESVYSKNRHFRVYKSSKFGKIAPFLVSKNNKFQVLRDNSETTEEALFLHSLITWISKHKSYINLEFPPYRLYYSSKIRCNVTNYNEDKVGNNKQSPFPDIDKCISDIVHPGKIWRSLFFREKGTIVYDIVGNRFCLNIGRSHKSNNVKYVVDLATLSYYQKCHDPDCADFKSAKRNLPVNEYFFLNNDIDDDLIVTAEEYCQTEVISGKTSTNDLFNSSVISDEECFEAAKNCELFYEKMISPSVKGDILHDNEISSGRISHVAPESVYHEQVIDDSKKLEDVSLKDRESKMNDDVRKMSSIMESNIFMKDSFDIAQNCEFAAISK